MVAKDSRLTEEHRGKIRNSSILNALIEHAEGRRDMSSTQVTAGLGLLKKVMPDMQATQLSGDENSPLAIQVIERTIVDTKDPIREGISPAPETGEI